MFRGSLGRGGLVVLCALLLLLGLNAATSSPVAGQGNGAGTGSYKIYLSHLSFSHQKVDLVAPVYQGIGNVYRFFPADAVEPGRVLVKWREGTDVETISQINTQYNVQTVGLIQGIDVHVLQVPPDAANDLIESFSRLPQVEYVEPAFLAWASPAQPVGPVLSAEQLRPAGLTTNDPMAGQQYSLDKMNVGTAWNVARGDNVVIAVLDTGTDMSHPDLQGKFVSTGRDFINNDWDASDDHGHGTHVAGIAAGATNNGVGVAGVGYNARILPVKVLAANGSGDHGAIAGGITWAADQGAKVINMSLGGAYGSSTLENAINYAWSKGAVVIAAAGNEATASPSFPASYANAIGIGATDQNDQKAGFSNYGNNVSVAAPGVAILSTVRGNQYQAWNGTSMAAPNAAGVAALVASARPTWSNSQIRAALENTADNIGIPMFGRGRLNAAAAVSSSGGPLPPVQPTATATPVPFTPPPSSGGYATELYNLINQVRAQNGLSPFRWDQRLANAADFHNRWMRDHGCFAHECPGEPGVGQRLADSGYPVNGGGENIGKGYITPQNMLDGWMASSGHRAALLSTYWPDVGCAYLKGAGMSDTWWTCDFASGAGIAPPPYNTPAPAPTRTPVPPTPTPTRTPVPTATPWPTWTPWPTVTPYRTPTPWPTQPPPLYPTATVRPTQVVYPTATPYVPLPTNTPYVPPQQPGQYTVVVTPEVTGVLWVDSTGRVQRGDDDLYAGWYANTAYCAAVQFRLNSIPLNAQITSARLELVGQTAEYVTVGSAGRWSVEWLAQHMESQFANANYHSLCPAGVRHVIGGPIGPGEVGRSKVNTAHFAGGQVSDLQTHRQQFGTLTLRLGGPTAGSTPNVMSWDSGYGEGGLGISAAPRLVVTYLQVGGPPPPSPTAVYNPPTATPWPTATPVAPRPGLTTVEIFSTQAGAGWVIPSDTTGNHLGDDDLYAGRWGSWRYYGLLQFDLSSIPSDATIQGATVSLYSQSRDYVTDGEFTMQLMGIGADMAFPGYTYPAVEKAPIIGAVETLAAAAMANRGEANVFTFRGQRINDLQSRLVWSRKVSLRLDGPVPDGSTYSLMNWDTGFNEGSLGPAYRPKLTVTYSR